MRHARPTSRVWVVRLPLPPLPSARQMQCLSSHLMMTTGAFWRGSSACAIHMHHARGYQSLQGSSLSHHLSQALTARNVAVKMVRWTMRLLAAVASCWVVAVTWAEAATAAPVQVAGWMAQMGAMLLAAMYPCQGQTQLQECLPGGQAVAARGDARMQFTMWLTCYQQRPMRRACHSSRHKALQAQMGRSLPHLTTTFLGLVVGAALRFSRATGPLQMIPCSRTRTLTAWLRNPVRHRLVHHRLACPRLACPIHAHPITKVLLAQGD